MRRALGIGSAVAVLALVVGAVVAFHAVSETGPDASDVPSLPAGLRYAENRERCGSGGCYRELVVVGRHDETPDEIVAALGRPKERCRRHSLLDPRRLCVGVERIGPAGPDQEVRLYVSLSPVVR